MKTYLRGAIVFASMVGFVRADDLHVYFGNLHSHTAYSDGTGTPTQAYCYARDDAKLNFLAVTDHNHRKAENATAAAPERHDGLLMANLPDLYSGKQPFSVMSTATRINGKGGFVALFGQEFPANGETHVNVFDVPDLIPDGKDHGDDYVTNGDYAGLVRWLSEREDTRGDAPIVQINHPAAAGSPEAEAKWMETMRPVTTLIEILNGPATTKGSGKKAESYEKRYLEYLAAGFHAAPTGDQDNHNATWGTATEVRTAVIATELTKDAILDALRARHVYATEDRNLEIIARVEHPAFGSHLMGDIIDFRPPPGEKVTVTLQVKDDDPGATYTYFVYQGKIQGPVAKPAPFEPAQGIIIGDSDYVLFKIVQRHADQSEDEAWTAPVWFKT